MNLDGHNIGTTWHNYLLPHGQHMAFFCWHRRVGRRNARGNGVGDFMRLLWLRTARDGLAEARVKCINDSGSYTILWEDGRDLKLGTRFTRRCSLIPWLILRSHFVCGSALSSIPKLYNVVLNNTIKDHKSVLSEFMQIPSFCLVAERHTKTQRHSKTALQTVLWTLCLESRGEEYEVEQLLLACE